ncbi:MAG: glycosyltransferase [Promethearchaeota archaeon]
MLKEILFISYHFPPFSKILSIRAAEIAKRLVNNGYKIFVVSAKSNKNAHEDFNLLQEVKSPLIKNKSVYNLSFVQEGVNSKIGKRPLYFEIMNLIFFLHWIPLAFLASRKLIRKNNISLIYVSAPPFFSLLLSYLLKNVYRIPLIVEYRDPWSYNPYLKGTMLSLVENFYLNIEKKVLKTADEIFAISEGMKIFLREKFPDEIKNTEIHVIPHGINIEDLKRIPQKSKISKEIRFTFTGNLYGRRDLKPLIKIVSKSQERGFLEDVSLKINIYGKYDERKLRNLFEKYKVSNNFNLYGFVPRNICMDEVINSSLALHVGENLNYPTLSFKVWEYLSVGKKILYLGRDDSYTADFIKKNNLGYTIPINDFESGLKRFEELVSGLKENRIESNIYPEQLHQYTWDNRVKEIEKVFTKFTELK